MSIQPVLSKVSLGQSLPNRLISRCDVAEGTYGRAVPLFDSVVGVNVFFSENPKGSFACTPEEAIKIGINPRFYYVIPVARLNTDAKGKPIDHSFKLEYLRLGVSQYEELCRAMEEAEGLTSFVLSKVKKGEYSYVNATISTKQISASLKEAINEFKNSLNEDQIFAFALADTARPFKEYLRLIGLPNNTDNSHALPSDTSKSSHKETDKIPERYSSGVFEDCEAGNLPEGYASGEFVDCEGDW